MKYKVFMSIATVAAIMFSGCNGISPKIEKAGVSIEDYEKWSKKIDMDDKFKRNQIISKWNDAGITDYDSFNKWVSLDIGRHNFKADHYRFTNDINKLKKLDVTFEDLTKILKESGNSVRRTIEWVGLTSDLEKIKAWKALTGNFYKSKSCKLDSKLTLEEAQDWKNKADKNCKDARRSIDKGIDLKTVIRMKSYKFTRTEKKLFIILIENNKNNLTDNLIAEYIKFFSSKREKNADNIINTLNSLYTKNPKLKIEDFKNMYAFYDRTLRTNRTDYIRSHGEEMRLYNLYFKSINKIDLGKKIYRKYVDRNADRIIHNSDVLENTTSALNGNLTVDYLNKRLIPIKVATIKKRDELMEYFNVSKFEDLEKIFTVYVKGYKNFIHQWQSAGVKYPVSWIEHGIDLETAKIYVSIGIKDYSLASSWYQAGIKTVEEIKKWQNIKGYTGRKSNLPQVKGLFKDIPEKDKLATAEEWISYGFLNYKSLSNATKSKVSLEVYRTWYKVDTGLDITHVENLVDLGRTPADFKRAKDQCKSYVKFDQLMNYPDEITKGTCFTGRYMIYERKSMSTVRIFIHPNVNVLAELDVSGIAPEFTRKGKMIYVFGKVESIEKPYDEAEDAYILELSDLLKNK
jgi:hypothetical protein